MNLLPFIGRSDELQVLRQLHQQKTASMVIVQGRRRIGKSRLIEEFAKGRRFYALSGIAPNDGITAQMQRDEFSRQLGEQLGLPKFIMQDWGDLFTLLAKHTQRGQVVILLDEISWMGSLDPTFLGKLKNAWDTQFKKNTQLMLVICGSVSSWIEKNIISSTLFLGRPSRYMKLNELSLPECHQFWGKYAARISSYEKMKLLSVTGGVPRYLEIIDPKLSAEDNIRSMCFKPDAPLLNEFDRIFSDIFGKRSQIYKAIIKRLVLGAASLNEILKSCGRSKTGDFTEYLTDLENACFIVRDYTWHLKHEKEAKLSRYRLKDNYTRFYLKYIEPNKSKINKGFYLNRSITSLPAWESVMGLQFEALVLNNIHHVIDALNIPLEEIIWTGPYFQRKTKKQAGCQIDLLIQTKYRNVYICEIKFSKTKVDSSVQHEVQQKIDRLSLPKNFSYRPILIHVNGVNEEVLESDFFAKAIDFGQLLSSR